MVEVKRYDQITKRVEFDTDLMDSVQTDLQIEGEDLEEQGFNKAIKNGYENLNPLKKALLEFGIGKWYIGSYRKPTWNSELPFYVWKCRDCNQIAFGYLHGHKKYLQCQNCTPYE